MSLRIVASRVGSIDDVLSGYGLSIVVSPGEVGQLKSAISRLIIDENCKGANVERWNPVEFDSQSMSKKYTTFYRQLMGG